MSTEVDIETIERSIESVQADIKMAQSLRALTRNPDFIRVIDSGYFEKEPSRLVLLKAEPAMEGADAQASIIKSIDGIGSLRQYFMSIMQQGNMAEKALVDHNAELDALRDGE